MYICTHLHSVNETPSAPLAGQYGRDRKHHQHHYPLTHSTYNVRVRILPTYLGIYPSSARANAHVEYRTPRCTLCSAAFLPPRLPVLPCLASPRLAPLRSPRPVLYPLRTHTVGIYFPAIPTPLRKQAVRRTNQPPFSSTFPPLYLPTLPSPSIHHPSRRKASPHTQHPGRNSVRPCSKHA